MTTGALPPLLEPLAETLAARLGPGAHGNLPRWLAALDALPPLDADRVQLGDTIRVDGAASAAERARLREALGRLHPWRKGPFSLFGVHIDTEWRSDWKWRRVAPHLVLDGARVLDVGCGNGYFGWRMLGAGARAVLGIDPNPLFCVQHLALQRYLGNPANQVLPLRFEELPGGLRFDVVFSMGVIYHRRDPEAHVARLHEYALPGGQVAVESLVVEGEAPLHPPGRYARMRNVHVVPTPGLLMHWLDAAGFAEVRLADLTATMPAEQRRTPWMHFESLTASLDPARPDLTIEGHPAPLRAVVVARKPV